MRMGLKFSKALIWQLGMWASLFACVLALVLFFLAAFGETKEADDTGRRLAITLQDGKIIGHIHRTDSAAEVVAPASEPVAPASEPVAPQEPEASQPEASQSSEPTSDESAAAPPPAATQTPDSVDQPVPGEELPLAAPPEPEPEAQEPLTIVPAANPLPEANPKLLEKSSVGDLPFIAPDGSKAWQYYSASFSRQGNEPMIALVITGLGHSRGVTERALLLPAAVTLSFSPYSPNLTQWSNSARLTAHEALLDLPLEPPNFPASDPGPKALLLDKGLQENESRLRWILSRTTGYVGLATPYNEVYTSDAESFRVLLQSLANRGLMLLVTREPARSEIKDLLDGSSTPHAVANLLVDEDLLASSIDSRLAALEQEARKQGYAIGVIQATPLSIDRVNLWTKELEARGIRLVPLSAVVKLRFS